MLSIFSSIVSAIKNAIVPDVTLVQDIKNAPPASDQVTNFFAEVDAQSDEDKR